MLQVRPQASIFVAYDAPHIRLVTEVAACEVLDIDMSIAAKPTDLLLCKSHIKRGAVMSELQVPQGLDIGLNSSWAGMHMP